MKTRFTCIIITAITLSFAANAQTSWQIAGNSNISHNNFIGTTNKTAFKIRTNNNVRMTINADGNIGIGTTAPTSMLDVGGTITGFDSYFGRTYPLSAGTSGASYSSVGYGLTFSNITDNYLYRVNNDYSSMLSFRSGGFDFNTAPIGTAGNVIPYTTAMRIAQNGNVGIGTSTPAYKLSVAGTGDFSLVHTGSLNTGSLLATRYAPSGSVATIENTGEGAGSAGLVIRAGSNVAAGARFISFLRPDGTEIGTIYQAYLGSIYYYSPSDKRLKNIIGTSQKGLADLMKIKIYDYNFKSDPQKNVLTGFMAQELYEIFPQSVHKSGDNNEKAEKDPWMVDYGSITPLIIKSVQEQQQTIDDLKEQNKKLQKQIDELKALMISMSKEKVADNQTALK